ncbi:cyclic nucleotide-binding/CBS domain-containing protein [Rhodobacteraceae bacterium F11138]|nr:cyclic nucleotide-binding/CBS domain-containing protein [Rhodobacteraceae bacterium F11138]
MSLSLRDLRYFLVSVHPYDSLEPQVLDELIPKFRIQTLSAGDTVYERGAQLDGLYLVHAGEIEVRDETGTQVSLLGPRNSFAERGLIRDGIAATSARAVADSVLLMLPRADFEHLRTTQSMAARFFDRRRNAPRRGSDLATSRVDTFMAAKPVTCPPETTVQQAAKLMHGHHISSVCIVEDSVLAGIVTNRDLTGKVLGAGLPGTTPVDQVMTTAPLTLSPADIGSDVLHAMMEHRIGHTPIVQDGKLVGIVTQTDLTRFQAVSSAELVSAIARAESAAEIARVTAEIPRLLVQLVAGGNRHEIVTRLITDIADTATRRLLNLAETELGPAPVPYLWLACGSQGRQEQTGVSDQDNCLILDDAVTATQMAYFSKLARYVSDGLDLCGYFYCPGDMMATNPRWCQPLRVWQQYFRNWIAKPDPEAQMLASVMFDLRPIGGDGRLFERLQKDTLAEAGRNSIFVAHMIANSLKHTPPLGLLRGFATIRSGEHRNTLDLKLNGVVPVVDLGRIYALRGGLTAINTRARLQAAASAGITSPAGARDLLDAYDLIAETRLTHQVACVKAGVRPDNFMAPSALSDFERSHLRDAFVVVKTMQAAIGHARGLPG